ncbi:MAG: hypothetical protein ACLSAH_20835 [Bilophila wadsworthia]
MPFCAEAAVFLRSTMPPVAMTAGGGTHRRTALAFETVPAFAGYDVSYGFTCGFTQMDVGIHIVAPVAAPSAAKVVLHLRRADEINRMPHQFILGKEMRTGLET